MKVSVSTVRRRLHEQKYRGYTRRCKPLISKKNRKARLDFAKKYRDEPHKFWDKVLWTDETKINIYKRLKFGERQDLLMIPNIQAHL